MKNNKFNIPYLTYEAIAEITGINLNRLYKKSETELTKLEQMVINKLRTDMIKLKNNLI